MDIFILKEIAKYDKDVWRLFSLLNKEMNEYFSVKGREYELAFRTIEVDEGRTCYKLDGKYHRSDGPAVIYDDGDKSWWFNGLLHRLDGPAVIYINCSNMWYKNGKYHRLDGPAVEYVKENMKKFNTWWIDGERIFKNEQRE